MRIDSTDLYKDCLCNPYAADFQLGVAGALDAGTPEGFTDYYTEYVYNLSHPILVPGDRFTDILQFDETFLVRFIKGSGNFLVRIRDIDGSFMCDSPIHSAIYFGPGEFPYPQVPDWFIPQGEYITIEILVV